MIYLFDSNIVLHYVRQSDLMKNIEQNFDPFGVGNESWLCVVSKGELRSIAIQNQWGKTRRQRLEELMGDFYPADIFSEETIDCYAEYNSLLICIVLQQRTIASRKMLLNAAQLGSTNVTTRKID